MRAAHDIAGEAAGSYWEPRLNSFVATVTPGEFAVSRRHDLALVTLLGSCVAACICDPQAGIGGLNHFLLPDDGGAAAGSTANAARYGVHAMELLINEILKQGGTRSRLRAKLFGGANVIALTAANPVGERNAEFSLDFLRREGIPVTATDLGGTRARRVFFKPAADKVLVQVLNPRNAGRVRHEEARFGTRAAAAPASGGVELF